MQTMHSFRSHDAPMRPVSRLVEASALALATTVLALAVSAPLAAQGTPMPVKSAYDAGLIMISVEIDAKDKRGDRLQLTIEPTDKPVTITVPADTTSLSMERPFDVLVFRAAAVQTFALTAGSPAKLVVNQVGERRIVSGKFQIAMDEGKPQFVGSATTDIVKPQH